MTTILMAIVLAGSVIVAAVLMHFWYVRRIVTLLDRVRKLRWGRDAELADIVDCSRLGQLAREFERLHGGLSRAESQWRRLDRMDDRFVSDRTEQLQRTVWALEKKVRTDGLTGAATRQHLEEQLIVMFNDAMRSGHDLACVMIDVDNFKDVNDLLGHEQGDRVIAFAGEFLRACVRQGDLCARYGGDEFVLLLRNCREPQASAVTERIRALFAREVRCLMTDAGESGRIGNRKTDRQVVTHFSIGLATLRKHRPADGRELLRLADEALYRAKAAGRNRVVVA